MPHSKNMLCMMLIPNMGNVETMMGNNAQWIAQAIDVAIPKASQFSLIFIVSLGTKVRIFALMLQISSGKAAS